jgi:hypothetical protein
VDVVEQNFGEKGDRLLYADLPLPLTEVDALVSCSVNVGGTSELVDGVPSALFRSASST